MLHVGCATNMNDASREKACHFFSKQSHLKLPARWENKQNCKKTKQKNNNIKVDCVIASLWGFVQ